MARLPRAVADRGDRRATAGAGRVRIGRDGEAIATYQAREATTLAGWRAGIDGAGRIMAAAGAREVFAAHARTAAVGRRLPGRQRTGFGPGRGALYSFHLMGSARMGGSPDLGCREHRRARRGRCGTSIVADGSAFPTASGVNPMITIEAIAHLNARRLAGRLT